MNRMHATKDFWLAALRADGPAFRAAVAQAGPEARVPSCPDWTVLDLVHHTGLVMRRVRAVSTRGTTAAPEAPLATTAPDLPEWSAALVWWEHEFRVTLDALDMLDPEQPAWNWAPQAKKAGFWHRRFAHELAVHRWDAQMASGMAEPIEAKLAADGVGEILDTWLPAGRRKGPTDRHGVVHLIATDASQEWFVRLRGEGIALLDTGTILDHDDHHTRVTAVGTASDLELALYGRLRLDVLDVTGDATLLGALRTG